MRRANQVPLLCVLALVCLIYEVDSLARADNWGQRRPNVTLYQQWQPAAHPPTPTSTQNSQGWHANSARNQQWGRYHNYHNNSNYYNNWQHNNTAPQYPGQPWRNQTHPYIQVPGAGPRSNFPPTTAQPNKNIGWWGFNAPNNSNTPQYAGSGNRPGFQAGGNVAPNYWGPSANATYQAPSTPPPNRNQGWGQAQNWGGRPAYNATNQQGFGGNSAWNALRPSTPAPYQPNTGGWGGSNRSISSDPQFNGTSPVRPAGGNAQWNAGGNNQWNAPGHTQPGWPSNPSNNAGAGTPGLAPLAPVGGNNQWNAGGNTQWNSGGNPQSGWPSNSNTDGSVSAGSAPLAPIGGNSNAWNAGSNTQGASGTPLAPIGGGGQSSLSYPGGPSQQRPIDNAHPYANLFN